MSEGARDKQADRSKAAFKLDLIETVNADPMLDPSDTKVIAAYTAVMKWPKREAWLSISRLRAMTSLSERQVSKSRARLAGKLKGKDGTPREGRVYLSEVRREGLTTVYRLDNPWRDDCRQHVAIMTETYREEQKDRQADRRLQLRNVPAISAETDDHLSQSPGDCDVPAKNAGNIPSYTPQDIALKGETLPIKVSTAPESNGYLAKEDDPHQPYPPPESEEELEAMLSALASDADYPPTVMAYFRIRYVEGRLTPAMIETQRRRIAS